MKLTDLAILSVIILLPIVIIVYVNTSFVIKSEKEEMYYENIIDSAVKDATEQMKKIENSDLNIDYGYSGTGENKVSVNVDIGISTFYNSLFNNFGIKDNKVAEEKLKGYIPVIAIMDYDGIYIHSAEQVNTDGTIEYVTKPKEYYLYTYKIVDTGNEINHNYQMVDIKESGDACENVFFQVTYTMDDYIYLDIYINETNTLISSDSFYLTDSNNNDSFVSQFYETIASEELGKLRDDIVKKLQEERKKTISNISMNAITQEVNNHNIYAKQLGINYNFIFTTDTTNDWYERINGIGMIAVVQGITLGNRYLSYNAYGVTSLKKSIKYYITNAIETSLEVDDNKSYLNQKLYHSSTECPLYKEYVFRHRNEYNKLTPKFFINKLEAATNGYLPCPVCHP